MELRRQRFRTVAGWCFARPAVAHECWVAALSCPGRSAARSGALQTRDRSSLWRSRISGAPLHFVTRCTASGTRDSVGRVRSRIHFSNSLPRSRGAFSAPGVCIVASLTPNRGVGGAPRNVRVLSGTPVGRIMTRYARRLARRLASHDAGRSPLGAPPWRFWARGPRFRLPHYTGAAQRAPRSQVVVPGGRGPAPPGANGYEPPPQDATLAPHSGSSLEHALKERGCERSSTTSICSQ
jgi:hypothetical protein